MMSEPRTAEELAASRCPHCGRVRANDPGPPYPCRCPAVGDLVWLPTPLRDSPEYLPPGLRDQALALEAEVTAEPGRVVSIEDGWAMVDRGSWGLFGRPVQNLTRAGSCVDCGHPIPRDGGVRGHEHCGPLPHTGPVGGPFCDRCV